MNAGIIFLVIFVILILFAVYLKYGRKKYTGNVVITPIDNCKTDVIVLCTDNNIPIEGVEVNFGTYANPIISKTNWHGEAYSKVDNTIDNIITVNGFLPLNGISTKSCNDGTIFTFTK